MKTIKRWEIVGNGKCQLTMPVDSKILSAKVSQNSIIYIFALVDTDNPIIGRDFIIINDGFNCWEVGESCVFIDTVIASNGYCAHVFDAGENVHVPM